ncbi:dihydroorotase [Bifidobacterium aemilianum]|uniref:Dihydroorotase n=1 Tax=Bifidobacterium aemilianum TaxID=2493120 RepID=A0A366K8D4_9BIFI|nr:dihydroorotase [Bifidobacterium aemilianum]RBP98000.1 dihydroorotase [Bifidobacterium aemilianum]
MVRLENISLWTGGETIDLVIPDGPKPLGDGGPEAQGRVDARGLTLAPGLADPHVHFRDPGQCDKETMVSGCAAAASGGYTDLLIMPNTRPAVDGRPLKELAASGGDLAAIAGQLMEQGADSVIDYLRGYEDLHGVRLPSRYKLSVCASMGREGLEAVDPDLWRRFMPGAGKDSLSGHPVVAISDDGSAVPSAILDRVLEVAQETGLPLVEHCEHHDSGVVNAGPVSRELGLPGIAEDTELAIVARDIEAAQGTGVHIHFQHVSTAGSFAHIRKAKAQGLPISCETAPHYLALCDEDLLRYGSLAKMNPPLRSEADRQATLEAVADGTVDMLATDHAPHSSGEKSVGLAQAPNGIIGLESAYGVCHQALVDSGLIGERRLIELMSLAPMRLMSGQATDIAGLVDTYGSYEGSTRPGPAGADMAKGIPDTPQGDSSGGVGEFGARRVLDLGQVPDSQGVALTILDNKQSWTIDPQAFHSKARNTPFGGWQVTGRPLATIIGSRLTFNRLPQSRCR